MGTDILPIPSLPGPVGSKAGGTLQAVSKEVQVEEHVVLPTQTSFHGQKHQSSEGIRGAAYVDNWGGRGVVRKREKPSPRQSGSGNSGKEVPRLRAAPGGGGRKVESAGRSRWAPAVEGAKIAGGGPAEPKVGKVGSAGEGEEAGRRERECEGKMEGEAAGRRPKMEEKKEGRA